MNNKKLLISLLISLLFFSFIGLVEARAGGGGSSGGGEGSGIAFIIAMLYYAIYKIRRKKMITKAKKDLENALRSDSSWDIKGLEKVVKNIFIKYQNARCQKDLSTVKEYMTNFYYQKAVGVMKSELNGKKNIIKDIKINKLTLMSVRDGFGKDGDMFAMEVDASMIDYTIDEKNGKFISSTMGRNKKEKLSDYQNRAMNQASSFKEYYIFIRHDGKWLLNNIKQKFSIISDVIGLNEKKLKDILKQEQKSDDVNDDIFYNDLK